VNDGEDCDTFHVCTAKMFFTGTAAVKHTVAIKFAALHVFRLRQNVVLRWTSSTNYSALRM
jgi:hypothetical protein